MASCPKCGKPRLTKDAFNRRRCPLCGILRGPANMDRGGTLICVEERGGDQPESEAA